jgi:nucleoside-diphosphate-sugar epimerase
MVLITGGSGLVGSHLLLELLRSGQQVKALCRPDSKLSRVRDLFAWYGPEGIKSYEHIQWVQGDLNDLPSLEAAFEDVTEVYHCAALISFDPRMEERLLKVNVEGTRNIVNLCLDKGVTHLYYTSSVAAVGGSSGILAEDDHWDPAQTNVYATSKYLAEMEVWRGGQEGLKTVITNPGIILGPGFWDSGSGGIFARVAAGLKWTPPGGNGFVGVWDVVRAFEELKQAGAFNERFILVAEPWDYFELMKRIAGLLELPAPGKILSPWQLELFWRLDWLLSRFSGRERRLSKAMARSLPQPVSYSSDKIRKRVGFEFQPIDEVLSLCADNFRESGGSRQS